MEVLTIAESQTRSIRGNESGNRLLRCLRRNMRNGPALTSTWITRIPIHRTFRRKQREEEMKSKIEGASLSEQATSALKQIGDVISNNSITIGDEHKQIRDILSGLTPEQRKEVEGLLHGNRPRRE
uniref:Uncharacterized protein n=1 Tax=Parascaris equorum TaxID=6256 RepID=A0A914RTJ6_PAREQ